MHKNLRWKLILVVAVVGGMGLAWHGIGIDLGLDLRDGAEILYKVHMDEAPIETSDIMNTTKKVMSRRINAVGVGEHKLEVSGDKILLQLPAKGEEVVAVTSTDPST